VPRVRLRHQPGDLQRPPLFLRRQSPRIGRFADGSSDWINNRVFKCGSRGIGGNYDWGQLPAWTWSNRVSWDPTGISARLNGTLTVLSGNHMEKAGWFIYNGPQTFANYSMWCVGNSPARTYYTSFRGGESDYYNNRFALAGDPLSAYGGAVPSTA